MGVQKNSTHTPGIKAVKGENFYRDAKAAKRVKLHSKFSKSTRATRDRKGNVVQAAEYQSSEAKPGRVQPDRRWFGNTRVIGQDALDHFRTALGAKVNDPYSMILRRNKLPMSLIQQPTQGKGPSLTDVEPFQQTFGPGAQRKRPRLEQGMSSFADLAETSRVQGEEEDEKRAALEAKASGEGLVPADREIPLGSSDMDHIAHPDELYSIPVQRGRSEPIYSKGQSRRIWGELYKVIDSSDVILHVLDARDPMGTRCRNVERHIREETPHKHLVYILNKVDLVPTWVTVRISPLPPPSPSPSPVCQPHNSCQVLRPTPSCLVVQCCYECGRTTQAGPGLHRVSAPLPSSLPPLRTGVGRTTCARRPGRVWAATAPRHKGSGRVVRAGPRRTSLSPLHTPLVKKSRLTPGPVDQGPLARVPHARIPRIHQPQLRQGQPDPAAAPVQPAALGQEADQRRVRWLPQRRQELHHQHAQEEEGVQRRADPR